jgi:hypothetical protein
MDPATPDDDPAPMFDIGPWLVRRRRALDTGEAVWLEALVDFDLSGDWQEDGRLTCAHWLMEACGIARSTAYEKIKVAHELRRRPVIGVALKAGEISYSAARAIAVLEGTAPETDQALVTVAHEGSVRDLERVIDYYLVLQRQECDGQPRWLRRQGRGVRIKHGLGDRLGSIEAFLTELEIAECERALEAFLDKGAGNDPTGEPAHEADVSHGVDGSARADGSTDDPAGPGDDGSAGPGDTESDGFDTEEDPVDESARADEAVPISWRNRRGDAFMAMVRTAMAHAHDGHAAGADRYMVHAVVDIATEDGAPRTELVDGSPLRPETIDRMCCDASFVGQLFHKGTEPLALGRRSRTWNTAQRRAIAVRDGGRCRFPGCTWRITDVHHLHSWDDGGPTDVANGALACDSHHTLLHKGFRAEGNANQTLTFRRPDGSVLGTSAPPARTPALLMV